MAHHGTVKPKSSFESLCLRWQRSVARDRYRGGPVSSYARTTIRARRITGAALLTLASALAVLGAAPAVAAPGMRAAPLRLAGKSGVAGVAAAAAAPRYANWPTFHGNPNLTGLSQDPAISALNAGSLGVRWMTHT